MLRNLRIPLRWAIAFSFAMATALPCAADESSLLKVNGVDKVEIRDVSPLGAAKLQVVFYLEASTNLTITQTVLQGFYVADQWIVPEASNETFELKAKHSELKSLVFSTKVSKDMAQLMQRSGKKVQVRGTLQLTAQSRSLIAFGKKTETATCPFQSEALLVTPDLAVQDTLAKVLPPEVENSSLPALKRRISSTPQEPEAKRDSSPVAELPAPTAWDSEMKQRAASNVVIIEASANVGLGSLSHIARLYRHGYRLKEHEVIAPLDLLDPVRTEATRNAGGFGDTVASLTSKLNAGEVQYRAWVAGAGDHISTDSTSIPLRFKHKLRLPDGTPLNLGIFEFAGHPAASLQPTNVDSSADANAAIQLSYAELRETEPFSFAALRATILSGSLSEDKYLLNPRTSPAMLGSPVFSQHGLLAIVDREGSAITAKQLERALRSGAGETARTASVPRTTSTAGGEEAAKYKVRMVSRPAGALVMVDGKPAVSASGKPVLTAESKATCTEDNIALITTGKKRRVSFMLDGYRVFSGTVDVDDDMTLSATLSR